MKDSLRIENLSVSIDGSPSHEASAERNPPSHEASARQRKTVVDRISLTVKPGEAHAIMGPNGSGKSSLVLALMGHPGYKVASGKAKMGETDLLSLKPNERVKKGLFLSFQNPVAVPGVTLGQLAWSSFRSVIGDSHTNVRDFYTQLKKQAKSLGLKEDMLNRSVNDGFSGGEKKKVEMLLLLNLVPKFVIFDEIDSGLDVDTLKIVAKTINGLVEKQIGVILITHNQKILRYVKPDFVHVLKAGNIVRTGGHKLASEIEERGYAGI